MRKNRFRTIERLASMLLLLFGFLPMATAQQVTISGQVVDGQTRQPVEFASVLVSEGGQWAITDGEGRFTMKNIPVGRLSLIVQCLGYRKRVLPLSLTKDVPRLSVALEQESLRLDEVTVVAKRKTDEATTSYTIDRTALENQQILNLGDVSTLLPGGKTVNPSLMSDERMSLRSGSQEKGNASFGTAIEVDGVRMDNNASLSETESASTRTVGVSNIESVEVITGIPSVEYGDLSNGVVKVNTRKGKSPFIVEGRLNQHTRQIALNKGFDLGRHRGVLNASVEHARSFSDAASPHTAYQRNNLSVHYMNIFMRNRAPLTLNVGLSGNIGGYNSEADPDEELDDYRKVRDNAVRASIELNWLLNQPWVTNLSLRGSVSHGDKRSESYVHQSSASTQPYIHARQEGYFIAEDYDQNPQADIILGPTGYWYVRSFNDSKPLSWSLKLKAEKSHQPKAFGTQLRNKLLLGAELTGSHNNGRGTYYSDMRYAPTWREYRYDELPAMNNLALYAEDKLILPLGFRASSTHEPASLEITAGLRDDITMISGSGYGTVGSLSPRVNGRMVIWRNRRHHWVSDFDIHAGWGKSVKLPSFQVLYPSPAYTDRLAFAPGSTADNRSYYAYYTHPSTAVYNPDLRWQYTNQADLGLELTVKGTRINVSAFHHKTYHPYMATSLYTPFAYKFTGQAAIEHCGIAAADRSYNVDRQTGVVTVSDRSGSLQPVVLDYSERRTFLSTMQYVNASPVVRYGLEWMVDFAQVKALRTSLRLDGNYYHYKGLDDMLFADIPAGTTATMSNGQLYGYVGYYRGGSATSAGYAANASVSNGSLSRQVNLNATLSTHIPEIRMIVALRLESSLYNYRRSLSELPSSGQRGIVVESSSDYFGQPYDGTSLDKTIAVYPDYYATWDKPGELIPFADRLAWAYDNDRTLYNDLTKLVVRSNYPYTMNPNRLSSYYSANLTVTKEIGDHVSLSFYANNFLNNMKTVRSSQTGLETSLFASGYIPGYYYGLSLKLKI